uniref:Uncharacterized protein n=1 Tax=Physcomitrium patens TaxID=3218 RepID=A0A7I4EYV9_PHYPA
MLAIHHGNSARATKGFSINVMLRLADFCHYFEVAFVEKDIVALCKHRIPWVPSSVASGTSSSNCSLHSIASHCISVIVSNDIESLFENESNYSGFCVFI